MKIEKVEVKDLNLPEDLRIAPDINWGADFEEFDDKRKIRYLKKLCSALNHATDLIQRERNDLLKQCHRMAAQVKNADGAVEVRKTTLLKALTDYNAEKQELIRRIQELEVETKNLNIQNKSLVAKLKKYEE